MAVLSREDVGTALGHADHVLEGEVRIGGQEHFYLETHVSLAIPRGEDGEMEVYCSTQNPTHAQVIIHNPQRRRGSTPVHTGSLEPVRHPDFFLF